jgi:hypothetical protein
MATLIARVDTFEFEKDESGMLFANYVVNLSVLGSKWSIKKRYSEFRSFYDEIKPHCSDIRGLKFPSKQIQLPNRHNRKRLDKRRAEFEIFLNTISVAGADDLLHRKLYDFLDVSKFDLRASRDFWSAMRSSGPISSTTSPSTASYNKGEARHEKAVPEAAVAVVPNTGYSFNLNTCAGLMVMILWIMYNGEGLYPVTVITSFSLGVTCALMVLKLGIEEVVLGNDAVGAPKEVTPSRTVIRKKANELSDQEKVEMERGIGSVQTVWERGLSNEGWKKETHSEKLKMTVWSRSDSPSGLKLWKSDSEMAHSARKVYDLMRNCEAHASWNPSILEYRTVCWLNDTTDITTTITPSAVGGVVTKREFCDCRSLRMEKADPKLTPNTNGEDSFVSASIGCTHPLVPGRGQMVRGLNGASGYIIHPTGPDSCRFQYMIESDVKGSIPKWAVQIAMTGVMKDTTTNINKELKRRG